MYLIGLAAKVSPNGFDFFSMILSSCHAISKSFAVFFVFGFVLFLGKHGKSDQEVRGGNVTLDLQCFSVTPSPFPCIKTILCISLISPVIVIGYALGINISIWATAHLPLP